MLLRQQNEGFNSHCPTLLLVQVFSVHQGLLQFKCDNEFNSECLRHGDCFQGCDKFSSADFEHFDALPGCYNRTHLQYFNISCAEPQTNETPVYLLLFACSSDR